MAPPPAGSRELRRGPRGPGHTRGARRRQRGTGGGVYGGSPWRRGGGQGGGPAGPQLDSRWLLFLCGSRAVPSDLADLDRLYAAVKAERGTLDILFANAGVGSQLRLGEITAEHIDETFDVNVKGTIFTVQKALPLMGKGGSIILTGSSAGTTGAPAFTAYSASKAAVRNLARTWAEDLKGTGIRVNVLSPGATATELAKAALGEEGQKAFAATTPLQRMADPAEIAAVAAFLASSDSSFMTASEAAVDGGLAQL